MTREFIVGAARSGKSRQAAAHAAAHGGRVIVVATAIPGDDETRARVERHRADRPEHWRTVEEPYAIGEAIASHTGDGAVVIVDCLTMWLANLHYGADAPGDVAGAVDGLIDAIAAATGPLVVISNEIGAGVVPADPESRAFVDDLGRLNQRVAAVCERVTLVVAGLPVPVKGHV